MSAGALRHRLAFEAPSVEENAFGETEITGWDVNLTTWGELIHQSGSEAIEAARLAGRRVLKAKIRTGTVARAIGTDWRMRDLRSGAVFNIKETDPLTQRAFVFLVVEGGA